MFASANAHPSASDLLLLLVRSRRGPSRSRSSWPPSGRHVCRGGQPPHSQISRRCRRRSATERPNWIDGPQSTATASRRIWASPRLRWSERGGAGRSKSWFARWRASAPTASLIAIIRCFGLRGDVLRRRIEVPKVRRAAHQPWLCRSPRIRGRPHPSISRDGSKVAFAWGRPVGERGAMWISTSSPRDSGELQRLTTNPARDDAPAWSPDGRTISTWPGSVW